MTIIYYKDHTEEHRLRRYLTSDTNGAIIELYKEYDGVLDVDTFTKVVAGLDIRTAISLFNQTAYADIKEVYSACKLAWASPDSCTPFTGDFKEVKM